eukprot:TRINITY_DN4873_c0_g1_i1.p1 TRINITY_DN4873_c0_g1~~TRINITY_DN4873_c0_g1_i1.p1  ORF type:complete len:1045 (+),score=331.69 TRINITY_DN4873_c0_g1_i1:420-3137(+)
MPPLVEAPSRRVSPVRSRAPSPPVEDPLDTSLSPLSTFSTAVPHGDAASPPREVPSLEPLSYDLHPSPDEEQIPSLEPILHASPQRHGGGHIRPPRAERLPALEPMGYASPPQRSVGRLSPEAAPVAARRLYDGRSAPPPVTRRSPPPPPVEQRSGAAAPLPSEPPPSSAWTQEHAARPDGVGGGARSAVSSAAEPPSGPFHCRQEGLRPPQGGEAHAPQWFSENGGPGEMPSQDMSCTLTPIHHSDNAPSASPSRPASSARVAHPEPGSSRHAGGAVDEAPSGRVQTAWASPQRPGRMPEPDGAVGGQRTLAASTHPEAARPAQHLPHAEDQEMLTLAGPHLPAPSSGGPSSARAGGDGDQARRLSPQRQRRFYRHISPPSGGLVLPSALGGGGATAPPEGARTDDVQKYAALQTQQAAHELRMANERLEREVAAQKAELREHVATQQRQQAAFEDRLAAMQQQQQQQQQHPALHLQHGAFARQAAAVQAQHGAAKAKLLQQPPSMERSSHPLRSERRLHDLQSPTLRNGAAAAAAPPVPQQHSSVSTLQGWAPSESAPSKSKARHARSSHGGALATEAQRLHEQAVRSLQSSRASRSGSSADAPTESAAASSSSWGGDEVRTQDSSDVPFHHMLSFSAASTDPIEAARATDVELKAMLDEHARIVASEPDAQRRMATAEQLRRQREALWKKANAAAEKLKPSDAADSMRVASQWPSKGGGDGPASQWPSKGGGDGPASQWPSKGGGDGPASQWRSVACAPVAPPVSMAPLSAVKPAPVAAAPLAVSPRGATKRPVSDFKLRLMFIAADGDGDGYLSTEDVFTALAENGWPEPDEGEANAALAAVDPEQQGVLNLAQFQRLVGAMYGGGGAPRASHSAAARKVSPRRPRLHHHRQDPYPLHHMG